MKEAIENVEKSETKAEQFRVELTKLYEHTVKNLNEMKQLDETVEITD